jgi:60 kDa SS-A/Ro ribonucleoprotein
MKLNTPSAPVLNHEGIRAKRINPEQQLRRSVMACMLWESEFYEDGQSIAARISDIIKLVRPEAVAAIAVEAREKMKLRHVPLLLVREMARLPTHRAHVAETLARVIQRPDELAEFLAIYWKEKKQPLSAQVKRGLAAAFTKFDAFSLAKYNRDGAIKLRDVLFLCHAKAETPEQDATWKQLIAGTLPTPDTWEVALSAATGTTEEEKAAAKKAVWVRLLSENKLGALALLRNLRNMEKVKVEDEAIRRALTDIKTERVLPFRFIAAARHAPRFEPELESGMFKCLQGREKLPGKTVLLIDTSPSMSGKISDKSELSRADAAFGLAVLLRELCAQVEIVAFSKITGLVPPRRGFALADAIRQAVPSDGTLLGNAVRAVSGKYDRLITITDEESQDAVCDPDTGKQAYLVNVASSKNGVGYGAWTHIDGWSEAVVDYIQAHEEADR